MVLQSIFDFYPHINNRPSVHGCSTSTGGGGRVWLKAHSVAKLLSKKNSQDCVAKGHCKGEGAEEFHHFLIKTLTLKTFIAT